MIADVIMRSLAETIVRTYPYRETDEIINAYLHIEEGNIKTAIFDRLVLVIFVGKC